MTALRRLVVWLLWPFVYEGQSLRPFGADECGEEVYDLKPLETQDVTFHITSIEPAKFYYVPDNDDVVRCDGGGKA